MEHICNDMCACICKSLCNSLHSPIQNNNVALPNFLLFEERESRPLFCAWGWTRTFAPYSLPMPLLKAILERFWVTYWRLLSNQQLRPSLWQNVIFGIISKQWPSTELPNFFIIVGKQFLWDCRRTQIKPKIRGYQNKIANKYETEGKIKKNDSLKKMDI